TYSVKSLFNSPMKNFVWSVGYCIAGTFALPIPPLAIVLFSAGGIHILSSLIQAFSSKSSKVEGTQADQIDSTSKTSSANSNALSIPITAEQEREKLVLSRLPGFFVDRLLLFKK